MRESVSIDTAKTLVRGKAIDKVVITVAAGRRWTVCLYGSGEFVLRSARQDPRMFVKLEAALTVIHDLGMQCVEIELKKWLPRQKTISAKNAKSK